MSDVANTLKASGKGGGRTNDHEQTMVVSVAQNQRGELREESGPAKMIRRLTPTERERLQGAPDGWTLDFGPSLADAPNTYPSEDRCVIDPRPDGRREAATGDGVAVPCAEWIARRLLAVEEER